MSVEHPTKHIKKGNRIRIIKALQNEDLRFEEWLEKSGVSRGTLNSHMKQLLQENKIKKQYSSVKNALVYSVLPETLLRELIIHDFVNFIGSNLIVQILEIEMRKRKEIILKDAFPYGTVEDFFAKKYKIRDISYRLLLNILKDEYGPWIEIDPNEDEWK